MKCVTGITTAALDANVIARGRRLWPAMLWVAHGAVVAAG
jgi:hypothetical protein